MGQSFIPPTATAVKASLAAAMSAPGPLPAFGCRTPMHVLRGDGFVAAWLDQNVNPNTPPLAVAAWVNGTVTYLPGPFSQVAKIRQQLDKITVTRSATGLDYTSSLYGKGNIPLPAGGVETVYGDGKSVSTGGVTPIVTPVVSGPVDPVVPADPIVPVVPSDPIVPVDPVVPIVPIGPVGPPPVNLGRVADLIAGLQLPHFQRDAQRSLVAELRAGTSRPLSEIAGEVAAFGIGPGQPQAVPWQEAVRLLRGESAGGSGSAPDTAPSGSLPA
jgi:hypothetical protein